MAVNLVELFGNVFETFLTQEEENILNGVSERNLCARLAQILEVRAHGLGLNEFFADVEYNRMQDGKLKLIRNGSENSGIDYV